MDHMPTFRHYREADIMRNGRGWSVHTSHHWDNESRGCETYFGAGTLGFAVYQCAYDRDGATRLARLTVNGKPMGRAEAAKLIRSRNLDWLGDLAIAALDMPEE